MPTPSKLPSSGSFTLSTSSFGMYDECGSKSFSMAVIADSTIFLSLILSTYKLDIAVSAFVSLRCWSDDTPCAKISVVKMQKNRIDEIFFIIYSCDLAFKMYLLE